MNATAQKPEEMHEDMPIPTAALGAKRNWQNVLLLAGSGLAACRA